MKVLTEPLSGGRASLTAYLQQSSPEMSNINRRPAVLVIPGGGYTMVSDREGEPVALAFMAEGYNAFVLRYGVAPEGHTFDEALEDAENALERIRAMADEWRTHPDQVAVCGFSAGGHLSAALSTMGRIRPNATILGYPCILAREDTKKFVLAYDVPSCNKNVDAHTPPAFLFHTADDPVVPVENSLRYADALDAAGVPFELHIFPKGPHGLSLSNRTTCSGSPQMVVPSVAQWVPLCLRWLNEQFPNF